MKDIQAGRIAERSCVVCTLTGHGLKDPDIAIRMGGKDLLTVEADLESVRQAIAANIVIK